MGSKRPRPKNLAKKLLFIRENLDGGLSQNEIIRKMNLDEELKQERVSKYERDILEPPLYVILRYAEIANVWVDVLIDDNLKLPDKIPAKKKSPGIRL